MRSDQVHNLDFARVQLNSSCETPTGHPGVIVRLRVTSLSPQMIYG
jgi:hypothetical protein